MGNMQALDCLRSLRSRYGPALREQSMLKRRLEDVSELIAGLDKECESLAVDMEQVLNDVHTHTLAPDEAVHVLSKESMHMYVHVPYDLPQGQITEMKGVISQFEDPAHWIASGCSSGCSSGCLNQPMFKAAQEWEVSWTYPHVVYPTSVTISCMQAEGHARMSGALLVLGYVEDCYVLLGKCECLDCESVRIELFAHQCDRFTLRGSGWMHDGWMTQVCME